MTVQKREEKRAYVRAVHIGIGRNNYFEIAELSDIEYVAYRGPERDDEIFYLFRRKHFIKTGTFDVQYLSTQREYRLRTPVATHLGRATGRIPLDDEEFRLLGALALAVGELARKL